MCLCICMTFLGALLLTFTVARSKTHPQGLTYVLKALTNLATKTGTHSFSTS